MYLSTQNPTWLPYWLSTQNPTWLPYWLALLAQVARLSDVQLLPSMENVDKDLSNLQNIICQKSLIKNSDMSHF